MIGSIFVSGMPFLENQIAPTSAILPASIQAPDTPPPLFFTHLQMGIFTGTLRDDAHIGRFVSKTIPLNTRSYAPDDLLELTGTHIDPAGRKTYLRQEALLHLQSLSEAFAMEFSRPLVVVSGYRSAAYQQRLWDLGKCSDTLCAPPGYSEHQLGLAIDIFEATTETDYLANRAFALYVSWLHDHAHLYGFTQSYQK